MCDDRESLHLISRSLLPVIRKNLKCSNQVILGAIGYTRIEKIHFLRTPHVSYVKMRWPTVHCFITTEMAYLPRKITIISHSYRLINVHLKMSCSRRLPFTSHYRMCTLHVYVWVYSLYSPCRAIASGDEKNNKTTKPTRFRTMLHILGTISYFVACLLHRSKNLYTRLLITHGMKIRGQAHSSSFFHGEKII